MSMREATRCGVSWRAAMAAAPVADAVSLMMSVPSLSEGRLILPAKPRNTFAPACSRIGVGTNASNTFVFD